MHKPLHLRALASLTISVNCGRCWAATTSIIIRRPPRCGAFRAGSAFWQQKAHIGAIRPGVRADHSACGPLPIGKEAYASRKNTRPCIRRQYAVRAWPHRLPPPGMSEPSCCFTTGTSSKANSALFAPEAHFGDKRLTLAQFGPVSGLTRAPAAPCLSARERFCRARTPDRVYGDSMPCGLGRYTPHAGVASTLLLLRNRDKQVVPATREMLTRERA